MKRKPIALGLGFGLILVIAGVSFTQAGALKSAKGKIAAIVSPSQSLILSNQYLVGTEIKSSIDWQTLGNFEAGEADAMLKQEALATLKGEMREVVLSDDGILTRSYVVLSGVEFSMEINKTKFPEDVLNGISKAFGQGVVVSRDRSGLIKSMEFPEGVSDYGREMIYGILKNYQVALPEGDQTKGWSIDEMDGQGTAAASYQLAGVEDDKTIVVKQKHLYRNVVAKIKSSIGRQGYKVDPTGEVKIKLDTKSTALASIDGEETLKYSNLDGKPMGSNSIKLKMNVLSRSKIDVTELQSLVQQTFASAKDYVALNEDFRVRQERAVFEARLGTTTLEEILQGLEEMGKLAESKDKDQKGTELFLKLRALVALHPEHVPALTAKMVAAPFDSDMVQVTIQALTNASTPAAQKALVDLTNQKRGDVKAMEALVPNLGFIEGPESFVTEALQEYRKDPALATYADYAYGTSALQLSKSDKPDAKERYAAAENEVLEIAAAANGDEAIRHQVDILGNLGSEKALPKIKESLGSSDTQLRSKAAYALRNNIDDASRATLFEVIKSDKEYEVRKAATEALIGFTPNMDTVNFAIERIINESNYEVRIALLQVINRARYIDSVRVSQLIKTASEEDAHPDVRSFARTLLDTPSPS